MRNKIKPSQFWFIVAPDGTPYGCLGLTSSQCVANFATQLKSKVPAELVQSWASIDRFWKIFKSKGWTCRRLRVVN